MSNILVTGSSGFLGRNLLKFSLSSHKISAIYRHHKPDSYGRDIRFIQVDLTSKDWTELYKLNADTIIHTAAMSSIDECESQPAIAERINYEATCQLADFAAQTGARLLFISTDVVFDGEKGDYSEKDSPNPQNIYAKTKVKAEEYILSHLKNYVIIRPSIFYGIALNGHPSFTEIMLKNLYAGKQVYLFTDQIRTPVFVKDLVSAIWELTEHQFCGILHIGGPNKFSRWEIGQLICDIFNLDDNLMIPVKSSEINLTAWRPLDCSLDIRLARSILSTKFVDCKVGFNIAFQ